MARDNIGKLTGRWIDGFPNRHTRRSYATDIRVTLSNAGFTLSDSVARLAKLNDKEFESLLFELRGSGLAPKTINRRMTSIRAFLQYLSRYFVRVSSNQASEDWCFQAGRGVPHVPVRRAVPLSSEELNFLFSLPKGASCIAARDRAIMRLFADSGLRPGDASRVRIEDLRCDEPQFALTLRTSGHSTHCVRLGPDTGAAVGEYLRSAGLSEGTLFRAIDPGRRNRLANYGVSAQGFCHLLNRYLRLLPNALHESTQADGSRRLTCVYSPESLRITAANNLLTQGAPINQIQEFLGHKHVRTTRVYLRPEKRRGSSDSGSESGVPLRGSMASSRIFEEKMHNVAG